jgi:hypothetical protein
MSDNPYNSPIYGELAHGTPDPFGRGPAVRSLGTFVLTILIIDLVLCSLRLIMAALGVAGYAFIAPDDPMRATVIFEVGTGLAIALFGIPANLLILLKNRIGIYVAVIKIVFTLANMLVGIWQAFLQFGPMSGDVEGPERAGMLVGFMIGVGFVVVFRFVLMGLYIAALVKANKVLSE